MLCLCMLVEFKLSEAKLIILIIQGGLFIFLSIKPSSSIVNHVLTSLHCHYLSKKNVHAIYNSLRVIF